MAEVVVYHSGHGHTREQAEAVAQGAGAALRFVAGAKTQSLLE